MKRKPKGRTQRRTTRSRRMVAKTKPTLHRRRGPFSKSRLVAFEHALLAEKQRLLRQCSFTDQVMDSPEASGDLSQHRTHIADQGTENYQREMASRLKSIESKQLREIDDALARIGAGTYGVCSECRAPISRARLEVVPHARLCMKCLLRQQ
jgi:RNA polymerase-binding transcription factor DksA